MKLHNSKKCKIINLKKKTGKKIYWKFKKIINKIGKKNGMKNF